MIEVGQCYSSITKSEYFYRVVSVEENVFIGMSRETLETIKPRAVHEVKFYIEAVIKQSFKRNLVLETLVYLSGKL